MSELADLIEISRLYGADKRFVIAGGGNTSYKTADTLWVKASGAALATIAENGFAVLDRSRLRVLSERTYSSDSALREEEVKNDLAAACISSGRRPSVEASMHNAIGYAYVVHTHPTVVNALMCAQDAESRLRALFGAESLFIAYTDPGYVLFKNVETAIKAYRDANGEEPKVIWLQNHGIFVAADTVAEVKAIYGRITATLEPALASVTQPADGEPASVDVPTIPTIPTIPAELVVPALRMLLSGATLKTLKVRHNALVAHYADAPERQAAIARPFTPDAIVYCKSNSLFFNAATPEAIIAEAQQAIPEFIAQRGHAPKVLLVKGIGLIAAGDSAADCETILDVFEDAMKTALWTDAFGGPHPMTQAQIDFIDNWEVENYRRSVAATSSVGRVENKTIIVTGAAQGFGEGIARCLMREGANVVVADLNEAVGRATVDRLNTLGKGNRALFVSTNVAEIPSIEALVHETVCAFGAVDCFISNAGVLRAGTLDDMTPENFDFVTRINYNAYFYCTKVVSRVQKLQTKYSTDYYADIIQINSKSGLRGSKANFAYAGGKFGGVGLTQSFALELAPFRIKVNSICPGNFYEGPLWSDPVNGLFVQYLNAGKVPGAKTVDDVKNFYLAQVPMNKGCSPEDVTRGALYLIEQCGETGQALPITGGQVMLA